MSLATLDGTVVSRARVQVPAWGCWWADVDLADAVELSGSVTLTLADVALVGTVVSGGAFEGRAGYRIVGGAGGWGAEIAAKGYRDDAGVKLATVAGDAAAVVGETLAGVPTTRLGTGYARTVGPASRVMHDVAPRAWYVDFAGVTQFGVRAESEYTGAAARTRVDRAVGVVELATDQIATLVPGVVVDDLAAATDVEYSLDADRLTVMVYAGPCSTRRVDAWAGLLDALDPQRHYRGSYEYRVVTQSGERLNLQAVRAASGKPDLALVPVRPGMAGERATVTLGELVLVTFVDADPSRPAVTSHEAPDAPGWSPTLLELGDTGGEFVALSAKVDALFDAIHEVMSLTWVPVALDGGAALSAAWKAAFLIHPLTNFASVAAAKVKAK